MAIGERADLVARLSLAGDFAAKLKANQTALGNFQAGLGRTGKGLGQVGTGLARVGAIAATTVVAGLTGAAKIGADFEAQLNTINTIARATPEGLSAIGDGIREIARDTGKPLEELTQGYYDLLSAGVKAADAQNVLTQANTLAIGGLGSTAETVDLLTTAINVYGGDASKAAEYTDDFATAIERGKVTAAELAGSYAQVAPLARSLGIENNELAAGYARLTASGTPAAEAATQMASAMTALLKTTPGLEGLQKATGKNYAAIAGKQGLNVALEQMRVDAEAAGIKLIDLVGRKEALLYILQTTGPNLKAYNADLAAMGTNAGTAAEQMSERQKGLAFEIGRLGANLKDAAIELSAGFLPALSRSAGKLTEFLNTGDNRKQLRAIGEDIGRVIDSIDWGGVLKGAKEFWGILKQAGTAAKTIFDVINLLPTEIKAAGLGLIGLNKLSGGLIGSGLGNIVGGLGEVFAKSLGSMLPGALGKAFVQPVFVTNWKMMGGGLGGAGGAAGGAGGGLLGALAGAGAGLLILDGLSRLPAALDGVVKTFSGDKTGPRAFLDAAKPWLQGSLFAPFLGKFQELIDKVDPEGAPGMNKGQVVRSQPFDGKVGRTLRTYSKTETQRGAVGWGPIVKAQEKTTAKTEAVQTSVEGMRGALAGRLQAAAQKQAAATERSRNAITARLRETKAAQLNAANRITAATRNGDSRIVSAIRNNRPQISVKVTSNTIRVTTSGATVSRNINPNYMRAGTG